MIITKYTKIFEEYKQNSARKLIGISIISISSKLSNICRYWYKIFTLLVLCYPDTGFCQNIYTPEYNHAYTPPSKNQLPPEASIPNAESKIADSSSVPSAEDAYDPRIPVFLHPNLGVTVSSFNSSVLQQTITETFNLT